jgi:hypothetical protein
VPVHSRFPCVEEPAREKEEDVLGRFFRRHHLTVKKSLYAAERQGTDVARTPVLDTRAGFHNPARLVFIDETATSTNMVWLRAAGTNQSGKA